MLPEFLAGSYRRYKEDTTLFITWLAKAAASSGYKPDAAKRPKSEQPKPSNAPARNESSESSKAAIVESNLPPSGRLKGKERKAAKDAAHKANKPIIEAPESPTPSTVKYTITTGELLRQAEAVTKTAENARVKMPASLRAVVERAIRARQRCSEWFRKSDVQNQYADKQHTHFIEVLEQSLRILEPCVEAKDSIPKQQKQGEPPVGRTASVTNRFAALKVEESPDIDPEEVSEVAAAVHVATKTKSSKGAPEIAVYELEDEDKFDEDLAFLIFC